MSPENKSSHRESIRILQGHLKNGTIRDVLRDWKWIFSFCRGHWHSILGLTLFGLGASALGLASSVVSRDLMAAILNQNLDQTIRLIPALILAAASGLAFSALNSRYSAKLNITMQNHVQSTVFDRLIHSEWQAISRFSSGDLLNRFSGDVSTVSGCALSMLPTLVVQLFSILATLGIILYYDPMMALIGCASTPVLFLMSHQLVKKQRDHNLSMRRISSDLSSFQSETFRNIDTLKSFGIEDQVTDQLRDHQNDYRDAMLEYNRFSIQTHALLSVLNTAVQYIVLGYCLWQMWNQRIDMPTVILFLQLRSSLQGTFSSLIGLVPNALRGSVAAERLRELMELPLEDSGKASVPENTSCTVRIDRADVAYDPETPILRQVSLEAAPGQVIALIGPSGQGKTTLLRTLLGLIRPVSGEAVLSDSGQPPIPLSPSTRYYFSYVPQGNTLLAGTVAENLRMIAPDASDVEIIQALRTACAWSFVEKLPRGIHSSLGEGGKGISEGQAQRIAIARALMRNAPILLLDEVTSALDMETEERVLRNLMDLGLTCIVTTHRPSVLKMCSRVYRVQDGQVTELSEVEKAHLTASIQ